MDEISLADARRIALAAQGFDRPRPTGRVAAPQLRRVIEQLGLLQIDYVNVLVPAQYQVPFSRLGPYPLSALDDLVYRRREFTEQWAREASIVPVDRWALLRHRMDSHDRRWRSFNRVLDRRRDYAAFVLDEIRTRGPLTAADLPEPDGSVGKASRFWGWTHAKATLEAHFAHGALAIAERRSPGAARVYDLADRVLAPAEYGRTMDRDSAVRELVRFATRAHGIGTVADFADYYRLPIRDTRRHVLALVDAGELRHVTVEGWRESAYLHADAARPRQISASALLSPFDPIVWHRARAARLFDFDYLLEIWVPLAKRQWGYYVLPFLLDDRLVARVDLKADRATSTLRVIAAYVEASPTRTARVARGDDGRARVHDRDRIAHALAAELRTMASWLDLNEIDVASRGNFARPLAAAVRPRSHAHKSRARRSS